MDFISHLRELGVYLWVDEDQQLRYRAPKGVLTSALLAELRERKDELRALVQHGMPGRAARPPLTHISRSPMLPLSFAQERLWFLDQLMPHSPLYNIPLALRIEGFVQPSLLARAL